MTIETLRLWVRTIKPHRSDLFILAIALAVAVLLALAIAGFCQVLA